MKASSGESYLKLITNHMALLVRIGGRVCLGLLWCIHLGILESQLFNFYGKWQVILACECPGRRFKVTLPVKPLRPGATVVKGAEIPESRAENREEEEI